MLPDASPPAVTSGALLYLWLLAPPLLSDRGVLSSRCPRGDCSRSARPSGLHCLPTTHGDAPCARRLCSCALSAPSPCAPSPTRRRRLSDSPALPAHRQTEPSAPALVFFTSRAAAAVPRAAAHSPPSLRHATAARPRFRSSPRPTASRCHPAVPSASRGRSIAGLSRPRASRRRLRRPPPRVPPPPAAGAGDSAGGGRGEGRAWHHRSTRRRWETKMLKSGPSWQRGWQSTSVMV